MWQVLREKNYHEKMFKMQYGDLGEFESCFTFACPKFMSPCPPPIEPGSNYGRDAIKHQTQVFMDEVFFLRYLNFYNEKVRKIAAIFCI